MSIHISVVGVLLAALSAMVIGMIWYSPKVFGGQWTKILGTTDKEMKKKMGTAMIWLVAASLITAYVLAHFIVYTHSYTKDSWVLSGAETAFLAWLGFAATAVVAHGVFDPRDRKIMYINLGNRFVTLLAMGLILGAFLK